MTETTGLDAAPLARVIDRTARHTVGRDDDRPRGRTACHPESVGLQRTRDVQQIDIQTVNPQHGQGGLIAAGGSGSLAPEQVQPPPSGQRRVGIERPRSRHTHRQGTETRCCDRTGEIEALGRRGATHAGPDSERAAHRSTRRQLQVVGTGRHPRESRPARHRSPGKSVRGTVTCTAATPDAGTQPK